MGESFQGLEILIWAAIAGFILYRLRSVLGRRTGNERPPRDRLSREASPPGGSADQSHGDQSRDSVVALAKPPRPKSEGEPSQDRVVSQSAGVAPGSPIADALSRIRIADRHFEPGDFIAGAKSAYGMIIEAFASADESTLKPLLSAHVLADFRSAISGRAARGETVEAHVADIVKAEITDATLNGTTADITVRFESDNVRCVRDSENRVIEGDPTEPSRVTDIWTFSRDVESDDPNWTLIATSTDS